MHQPSENGGRKAERIIPASASQEKIRPDPASMQNGAERKPAEPGRKTILNHDVSNTWRKEKHHADTT